MELKNIKSFLKSAVLLGKNNLGLLIGSACVLIIILALRKSDMFMIIKAPSNRNVKIEINDIQKDSFCLEAPSREDSLLMMDVLYDRPYSPKKIEYVAVHITDSKAPTKNSTVEYWKNFFYKEKYPGSNMVGYNYLISYDKVLKLKPINRDSFIQKNEIVWGVANYNSRTISIAIEGGRVYDYKNKKWIVGLDTRTQRQKLLLDSLLKDIKTFAPRAEIKGHNQFPNVHKTCPNFKVN